MSAQIDFPAESALSGGLNTGGLNTDGLKSGRSVSAALLLGILLAGAISGVLAGLVARLAMRGVALLLGESTGFSLSGTLGIVLIFLLLGLITASVYLGALRWLPASLGKRTALLCGALLLLSMPFFVLVATGDLDGSPIGLVLALVLLFVPLPILMGLGIGQGGDWLALRLAKRSDARIGVGWAICLVLAPILLIVNLVNLMQGFMRHSTLLSGLMGRVMTNSGSALNMAVTQDRARMIALAFIVLWTILGGIVFWRDAQAGRMPLRTILLLALPLVTVMAVDAPPLLLSWLPSGAVALGSVQAAGIGLLLWLVLESDSERPRPWWLVFSVLGAWLLVALWLVVPALHEVVALEWVAWAATATALILLIVVRPLGDAGWRASTAMLALFAVMWLLLWAAAMTIPALQLRGYTGLQSAMSAPLVWLPWLLLPLAAIANNHAAVAAPAQQDSPLLVVRQDR